MWFIYSGLWFVLSIFFSQKQLGRYKRRMISKEEWHKRVQGSFPLFRWRSVEEASVQCWFSLCVYLKKEAVLHHWNCWDNIKIVTLKHQISVNLSIFSTFVVPLINKWNCMRLLRVNKIVCLEIYWLCCPPPSTYFQGLLSRSIVLVATKLWKQFNNSDNAAALSRDLDEL